MKRHIAQSPGLLAARSGSLPVPRVLFSAPWALLAVLIAGGGGDSGPCRDARSRAVRGKASAGIEIYTPRKTLRDHPYSPRSLLREPKGKELAWAGCRGEYETASVAVRAEEDIPGLRVTAGPLKGAAGVIPPDAVDIKVVKWWYQAGTFVADLKHKALLPELLLHDDGLVKVDLKRKANFLRARKPDKTAAYLLCSGPDSEGLAGALPRDASCLLPVPFKRGEVKQFFVTIRIPADCAAGIYRGELTFATGTQLLRLPLKAKVHPFDLSPPRILYAIYYRGNLSEDARTDIGSEWKSEVQYKAELRDMMAHGVSHPTSFTFWKGDQPRRLLEIRRQAGMPGGPFFNLGFHLGNSTDPVQLARLQERVKRWLEMCKQFGYDEVYFYGLDEARGERLRSQRAAFAAVQEAGGKTFAACYRGAFEKVGSLLNCAVVAGRPDPLEAARWHSVGSKIFNYAYPQVGQEKPGVYRRNSGLVLWKAGYDGSMSYAYQHGFGHIWNDFDSKLFRDHNFTYPTVDGVVGTIQWEGFREAVDDVRYVTTLEHAIAHARATGEEAARDAARWLERLDPSEGDLDEIREQVADWIVRLQWRGEPGKSNAGGPNAG